MSDQVSSPDLKKDKKEKKEHKLHIRNPFVTSKTSPVELTFPDNMIHVIVMEGRNLLARDVNGRSDPYCIVTYGTETRRTRICNFTLHPVWSWCVFSFEKILNENKLKFICMDYDKLTKDDYLGEVELNLEGTAGQVIDKWIELGPNDIPRGKIHVRIYNQRDVPPLKEEALGKSLFLFESVPMEIFKTGDCILYSGSELISGALKRFMHSPYSHCGIVLKMLDPLDPDAKEESVFIAEADWDDGDHFEDKSIYGIVVNLLKDRMKEYEGDVIWHCPLKEPLTKPQNDLIIQYIMDAKRDKVRYDVSQGVKMLMKVNSKENVASVFCSELVAYALKHAGVVPSTLNCSRQDPHMVSKFDCYDGKYPTTILRYQVQVDKNKLKGAGMQEIIDLFKT